MLLLAILLAILLAKLQKGQSPNGVPLLNMAISGSLNEMKWVKVPWFLAWGRG